MRNKRCLCLESYLGANVGKVFAPPAPPLGTPLLQLIFGRIMIGNLISDMEPNDSKVRGRGRPIVGSFRSKLLSESQNNEDRERLRLQLEEVKICPRGRARPAYSSYRSFQEKISGPGVFVKHEVRDSFPATFKTSEQSLRQKDEVSDYEILTRMLSELRRVEVNEKSVERFHSFARKICSKNSDLAEICRIIYEFSMRNMDNAAQGAAVFTYVKNLEVSENNIRIELMKKLQKDYEERDLIYRKDKPRFRMIAFFMAEILHRFRLPNGDCVDFLVGPTIDFFYTILDDEEGLLMLSKQILKIHVDLKMNEPVKFLRMYKRMRGLIITPLPSEKGRALLLKLLEQFLSDFIPFSVDVKEFYESYGAN